MYNILDFGAKNSELCTKSIQAAIDTCHENGGGTVVIPNGIFVSGTIWLKSNVELHLEMGAVLKASENIDDYNAEDAYPQNYGVPVENWRGKHLIIAHECDNVAITGTGAIDGSGDAFFGEDRHFENPYCWEGGYVTSKDKEILRPGQCVCFIECQNVKVNDISVRNTPCWSIFIHGCEYVQVRGVKITNPYKFVNTDGLDIDCCRFVTVSDCIIKTGDDAIAIRCDSEKLKNPKPCEYITVTNCVLSSNSSVFRFGVGTGEIRHVRISNLTVFKAGSFVSFCTSWAGIGNAKIEDVSISDVSANNILRMITCKTEIGMVRKILFKDMAINAKGGIFLMPKEKNTVSDITLRNVELTVSEKQWAPEKNLINIVNTDNVTFESVNVFCNEKEWEKILDSENNTRLSLKKCNFQS